MYEDSYNLNGNREAYFMIGKCALEMIDTVRGESIYRDLIEWYNEEQDSDDKGVQELEPHLYFINKHWERQNFDSANYYLDNARTLFGQSDRLDFFQKRVGMDQINTMPPSALMMEFIKKNLALFPTDTNFIHKENSLYVYLIRNNIAYERYGQADTLLNQFVSEKVERSTSKNVNLLKQTDDFIEAKPENVLWKLSEYYQIFGHEYAAVYILKKYIRVTAKDTTAEAIAARWAVIAGYAFKTKKLPFAIFVLQQSIIATEGKDKSLLDMRSNVIKEKANAGLNVDEMAAYYSLLKDEYTAKPKSPEVKEILLATCDKYVNLLVKAHRFGTAKVVVAELDQFDPDSDHAELKYYVAKEDFYVNYFLTKTKGSVANEEEEVVVFEWDGSVGGCDEGHVDPIIQQKVLDRINYFRRNAGVPEVFFDPATNDMCQKAALMMQANNKLDHEPTTSWRCYSDEGATAAKHSLMGKGNTSLAVTAMMADQENPSVGNRRWLLYPNGKVYGHGSTDNYCVIWALDDSGTIDTLQYAEQPVCWPPADYVPQMMLFKHWSFSIMQDLDSAQVTVTMNGKEVPIKVEKLIEGYGAPTLVFTPQIDLRTLPDKATFEVTVTLSNGSQYSYTVRSFYYDPTKV